MDARIDGRRAGIATPRAWPLRRSSIAVVFFLVALSVVLLFLEVVPLSLGLSGLLIIWISAFPALVHLQELDESPVPILPFAGLYYALFFGLMVFAAPLAYQKDGHVVLYYRMLLELLGSGVVLLVAGGVGAMVAAYYLAKFTLWRKLASIRLPEPQPDAGLLQALYWILIVASLSYRFSSALQSVPSIGQLLDPGGYLALGGFYLQWRAGHLPRWQVALVLMVVLPLEVYWRIGNFYLTELLFLPLFVAFILWRERQFKTLAALAVLAAMAAASYNITADVRYKSDSIRGKLAAAGEYISQMADQNWRASLKYSRGDGEILYDPRFSPLVHRMGQIWIFQYVYEKSPHPIPYWNGESYRSLLTSFIPRLIFPDKPEERVGGEFGYRYGFDERGQGRTSFNIPWITELLANFGPRGVLLGMAVIGVLLAALDRLFNARSMSEPEFLIGLTLIFRLGYQESNFSVMTGSLLPLFVCLYVYFRFGSRVLDRLYAVLQDLFSAFGKKKAAGPSAGRRRPMSGLSDR